MGLYVRAFFRVIWNGLVNFFNNFFEEPVKMCGLTVIVAQFVYWVFIFRQIPIKTDDDRVNVYFGCPILIFGLGAIILGIIFWTLGLLVRDFFKFFREEFSSQLILERNRNPQVPEIEEVPSFRKRLNQKVNEIKGRKPEINQRLNSVE